MVLQLAGEKWNKIVQMTETDRRDLRMLTVQQNERFSVHSHSLWTVLNCRTALPSFVFIIFVRQQVGSLVRCYFIIIMIIISANSAMLHYWANFYDPHAQRTMNITQSNIQFISYSFLLLTQHWKRCFLFDVRFYCDTDNRHHQIKILNTMRFKPCLSILVSHNIGLCCWCYWNNQNLMLAATWITQIT